MKIFIGLGKYKNTINLSFYLNLRIVMGYTLQIWWFRALEYLSVYYFLGPHLVAIIKMVHLIFFVDFKISIDLI